MRFLLTAVLLLAARAVDAKTLVITHPENRFDEKSYTGPRTQELLAAPGFRRKLVLMVYPDRNEYTFNPKAPGVAFERKVSSGGQLEEDVGDTDFVVGGGFLSACMQDTVTDLIQYSKAEHIRVERAATYSHVSLQYFPGATSTAPRNLRDYAEAAAKFAKPRELDAARVTALEIGHRIYGSLRKRGLDERPIDVRWQGATLQVVDRATYIDRSAGETRPSRARSSEARRRGAPVVLDFD